MSLDDECGCGCGCSDTPLFVSNYPTKENVNKDLDQTLKKFDLGMEEYKNGFEKRHGKVYYFFKNIIDYFKFP